MARHAKPVVHRYRGRWVFLAAALAVGVLSLGAPAIAAALASPAPLTCTGTDNGDGSVDVHCVGVRPAPSPTATPTPTVTASPTPTATATLPPTTTPAGTNNCIVLPSRCGFPDATNSGVPNATILAPAQGDTIVTVAGSVLDGRNIHGCLTIIAPDVTVRNTLVTGCGSASGWAIESRGARAQLSHVTVTCNNTQGKGVVGSGFTANALDISGCEDGFYVDPAGASIFNSYVHGMFHGSDGHTDAVQIVDGGQGTVSHNTLDNRDPQGNSAISADTPGVHDLIFVGNLTNGGGFSVRCPADNVPPGHGTNVRIVNNRLSSLSRQFDIWNGCGNETQVTGNVVDETGRPVSP